ncbi:MAG: hybrid sensor histidine kinase/response regulator, partial [Bryobacterales bacterium]|nr:hybrid sensor histidine kinase/response regulator [Bryobacterales bacterium]
VVLIDAARQHAGLALEPGAYVCISVRDDGPGIDPAILQRIFDPFFTTKGDGAGVGLGLSSAQGIVQQAKGDLVVETEPGRGSTFRLYLPRVAAEANPASAPAIALFAPSGGERVLLVEDQELVRQFLASALAHFGYAVRTAGAFDEALAIARAAPDAVDVIVTDVDIP